ncbi:hypothetical protein ACA910_018067 [Epithemia clementina (nom. ined.)]
MGLAFVLQNVPSGYGFSNILPTVTNNGKATHCLSPSAKSPSLCMYVDLDGGGSIASHTGRGGGRGEPEHKKKDLVLPDTTRIGNLEVPSVGIGTISWSSKNLFNLENDELQELVDTACASNAAFFDTAERYGSHMKTALGMGYGETEQMLQKFVEQSPSTKTTITSSLLQQASPQQQGELLKPVIATKFTPLPWRTNVESVVKACEESCRRLGVDQIDLYQLHMPDIVQPFKRFAGVEGSRLSALAKNKDEIYWQGLAECYNRGLAKNVGVCNYGPTLLRQCQDKLAQYNVPLASNQIAFSLIGRHNGAQETVDYCNDQGIQVLAFYPLAMGLLTGKYNSLMEEAGQLTKSAKTFLEYYDLQKYAGGVTSGSHGDVGGFAALLKVMQEIARAHGNDVTIAQVALNYVMCKNVIPIPGARNTAQLLDNIGAMGWRLSPEEVQRLEATADSLGLSGFEGAGFKRTSEKFVGYGVEKWSLT